MASSAKLGIPDSSDNHKDPEGGLTPSGRALNILSRGKRPQGMSYKGYKAMCAKGGGDALSEEAFKALPVEEEEGQEDSAEGADAEGSDAEGADAEDEDEDEDEDDDDDAEDEEKNMANSKKAKKSLSVSDLMKSVEAYDAVEDALTESGPSRETYLQAKYDVGNISKSERAELGRIWNDADDNSDDVMSKAVIDHIEETDAHAELVDASDFLKSLVGGIDHRMDRVETEVLRDGRATRQLLKAQGSLLKGMASVISEQDEIIKSLGNRVETVESTPAQRRSITTDNRQVVQRQLAKSVNGGEAFTQLTKGDVKSGLRSLMVHASDSGDNAAMDRITHATALFEQTGDVPENVMQAIRQVAAS